MNRTLVGVVVAAAGVALALISALANQLDIGEGGFGWKQVTGVIVGAALAVVGAAMVALGRRRIG